jgi:chorismate mutase/prephenate dehydratase
VLVRDGVGDFYPEGQQKLSLCCEVENRAGALAGVLAAVASAGGNLCLLQPRPVQGRPWRYYFFLDIILEDAASTGRVLEQLPGLCRELKVLGRYRPAPEFLDRGQS